MLVFIVILTFFGVFGCCVRDYEVPVPTIELIYPKGFSVRIPHSEGITLFAFHGKINEEMRDLEAGRFSKDILKKRNNFWTFEDRRTRLHIGDKIYYWLFVIKDGLGFRYDDGEYTITENTLYRTDTVAVATTTPRIGPALTRPSIPKTTLKDVTDRTSEAETTTNIKSTTSPNDVLGTTESTTLEKTCENTILNISMSLLKMQDELNSLKDTNEILKEISEKHPKSARTLRVEGRIPVNEDALLTVKGIIKQKLALSIEIVEAERNKDGSITFQTENLDDKVQIIKTAKQKLKYSMIQLVY